MSGVTVLQTVTQIVFVAIFLITVWDLFRHRDRARLEIMVLFGSLALIVFIQGAQQLSGGRNPAASYVALMVFLAQPYLLLRLVRHFRPIPAYQQLISLCGLILSWAVMLAAAARRSPFGAAVASHPDLKAAVAIIVVLAFCYVEGYATVTLVRAALSSRGVTQRRLAAAAFGSGFLGVALVVATVSTLVPSTSSAVHVVSPLLTLGAALSYFLGFAPPRQLRQNWQMAEFRRFLAGLAGKSAEDRFASVLDRVGPAAMRAVGGRGALLLLGDDASSVFHVHPDPENREALAASGLETVQVDEQTPVLLQACRERRALVAATRLGRASSLFGESGKALVSPLIAHGELYGLLLVFFDSRDMFLDDELELLNLLSEQAALTLASGHLIQRLQDQNRQLEDASRLKSEFLANMSHELRTPLNAILGFSELLLEPDDIDAGMQSVYLERIHGSGKHLLALINDILDLAKVEAGRMELFPEQFSLPELVDQVLNTVQPLAQRKHIQLLSESAGPIEIVADAGKVKQMLYNLVSNALKFTPEDGQVRVESRGETGDDQVELIVSDTGIGIAPEDHERVFQEFQQVEGGSNRRYEGTGLGLALTKRFAELHGGSIWLESELGRGSQFHIRLPRSPRNLGARLDVAGGESEAAAHEGSGPLVLVVDDDTSAAQLMGAYLARGGYSTQLVHDARLAVQRARELQPATITLDVMMPGVDGWQVLRELKADAATRDIPVLIASIVDDQPLGYALGATDYLVKPIEREVLLARLARYTLRGRSAGSATTLLAADDDPAALDLVASILEPLPLRLLRAGGGAEAIELLRREQPDILLLDLLMPEVSGFDVVRAARNDPASRNIPIFIMTAKDLTADDRAALNGHVSAVLRKDGQQAGSLLSAINHMLDSGQKEEVSRAGQ